MTPEDYELLGVDPVLQGPTPVVTQFQNVARDGVVQDANGDWFTNYVVIDWPQEEIDNATAQAWASVREERDRALDASDWVVTRALELGEAVPSDWAAYRQAWRDITTQPSPFVLDRPTAPDAA